MPAILKVIFSRRMLVALLMGFSSGLPLLLVFTVLQAWLKDAGVALALIGLTALVRLPYELKFFWAPFLDRFVPPFLGRRRGWLLIAQAALILSIIILAFSNPASFWLISLAALAVAFCSATQDIVIDAYRREDLNDKELGLGSSLYVYGYRVAMLLAGGGGLIMADHMPFKMVYLVMASTMSVGLLTTLLTPEPKIEQGSPQTIKEAVIDPFVEYFSRNSALWILAFILLYKLGDNMAGNMTMPFYLDLGFTKTQIGTVVKLYGFWATMIGTFLGGLIMLRWGINSSLWFFGVLQGLSTAGFAVLAHLGPSLPGLAAVISFENLSSGMGTAAFVGFMASLTNKKFTATQYALLTSLMAVSRDLASSPTGYMVNHLGYSTFFILCALVAIPGLLVLFKFLPWFKEEAAP